MATTAPVFFVSYARADAEFAPDRADLIAFVEALSAKVARLVTRPMRGICFFDANSIETGEVWTTELSQALEQSLVAVPLYTPNYFTRPWCGREYQVFRQRRRNTGHSGIVPVLWSKCTTFPGEVEKVQYKDAAFPIEYTQVGMQQLQRLKVYSDQYELALTALANRIFTASTPGLHDAGRINLDTLASAWDLANEADPQSHTEGSLSKTCFVFVARQGWDWEPYPKANKKIGALAQEITGALGLRYEEIKCDDTLTRKLAETYRSGVPTVLFGDPDSLQENQFVRPMQDYDTQFLLNCAALLPWDEQSKTAGDADTRWQRIRRTIFRQKTEAPPPYHEWRTIFCLEDLRSKTRTTIEQLRSRLLKQILSRPPDAEGDSPPAFRKVEDARAAEQAAAIGIPTGTPVQLEGPTT